MKEFFLSILKSVLTYVTMAVILFIASVSITSQKFPPEMSQIRTSLESLKNMYGSIGTVTSSLKNLSGQMKQMQDFKIDAPGKPEAALNDQKPVEPKAQAEVLETLLAEAASNEKFDPMAGKKDQELWFAVEKVKYQNKEILGRLEKIQNYLGSLHAYVQRTSQRTSQESSTDVQVRVLASQKQNQPMTSPHDPRLEPQNQRK